MMGAVKKVEQGRDRVGWCLSLLGCWGRPPRVWCLGQDLIMRSLCGNVIDERARQREELVNYKAGTSLQRNLKKVNKRKRMRLIVSGLMEFYSK